MTNPEPPANGEPLATLRADVWQLSTLLNNLQTFLLFQGLTRQMPRAVLEDAETRLAALLAMVRAQLGEGE